MSSVQYFIGRVHEWQVVKLKLLLEPVYHIPNSKPQQKEMDYRIFCVLPDGRPTFPVKIAKTETVGDLKEAIKVKLPLSLNAIEAHDLTLYHVNLDCSDEEYIKQAKLLAENPANLP